MSKLDVYPQITSDPSEALMVTGTEFQPEDKVGLDVNIVGGTVSASIGEVSIKAPTGPFTITVTTVTDVAALGVVASLADRVSLSLRNKSATVTIYIGPTSGVTANDAATGGWEIGPSEDFNIDLDDAQDFYLIAPAGQSALVKILEIANT